jgi:hypothetical protein
VHDKQQKTINLEFLHRTCWFVVAAWERSRVKVAMACYLTVYFLVVPHYYYFSFSQLTCNFACSSIALLLCPHTLSKFIYLFIYIFFAIEDSSTYAYLLRFISIATQQKHKYSWTLLLYHLFFMLLSYVLKITRWNTCMLQAILSYPLRLKYETFSHQDYF